MIYFLKNLLPNLNEHTEFKLSIKGQIINLQTIKKYKYIFMWVNNPKSQKYKFIYAFYFKMKV